MRRKVEEMQRLLSERKNKLRATEVVIEKKGAVVNKVQKILHSKYGQIYSSCRDVTSSLPTVYRKKLTTCLHPTGRGEQTLWRRKI